MEMVIALMMYLGDPPELKEHLLMPSISECLKGKRVASRKVDDNVEYQCIKSKAELEDNIDGSKSIKKLILE